jgi:hypothetical protein
MAGQCAGGFAQGVRIRGAGLQLDEQGQQVVRKLVKFFGWHPAFVEQVVAKTRPPALETGGGGDRCKGIDARESMQGNRCKGIDARESMQGGLQILFVAIVWPD